MRARAFELVSFPSSVAGTKSSILVAGGSLSDASFWRCCPGPGRPLNVTNPSFRTVKDYPPQTSMPPLLPALIFPRTTPSSLPLSTSPPPLSTPSSIVYPTEHIPLCSLSLSHPRPYASNFIPPRRLNTTPSTVLCNH